MGLDITAYKNIRPSDDEDASQIWINSAFASHAEALTHGMRFEAEKSEGFRAGSYGGYNQWRNDLAKLAGYLSDEDAWTKTEGPFWELINFSDCEGVIGPKTSAKLHADFIAFDEIAKTHSDEWFYRKYQDWTQAFELASQNGLVAFH